MEIKREERDSKIYKLYVENDKGEEVARSSLVMVWNDLHDEPYGLMEDVFVDESLRGQGMGTELVNAIIEEAKKQNCHKLICTSRFGRDMVHELYKKLGFREHGTEFRMNF